MRFGYFTLSDNHYDNNQRAPNAFVADIVAEAIEADRLGFRSAWIGEHHFSTLGVLSCPDLALAYVAARTQRIRLAPAVTVLPLHHPIRVAEQWASLDLLSGGRVDFAAGRGYDRREYVPLGASFEDNLSVFAEGMEIVQRLWASNEPLTHAGSHYRFEDVRITPRPVQQPIPSYVASFSRPSVELAARLGCGVIVAPFAAAMTFGGLAEVGKLVPGSVRAAGHGAEAADVQLLHPFPRHAGTRAGGAGASTAVLQGVRDPGVPRRPGDGAPKLPILCGNGGPVEERSRGGSDRQRGSAGQPAADHRGAEAG